MQTYQKIKQTEEYKKDNNACCVVASSIIFNTPFHNMQDFYRSKGRRLRSGTRTVLAYKCIEQLAKTNNRKYKRKGKQEILKLTKGKTMTVNNCSQYLDSNKDYVLFSISHAIAVKGGKVEDWSEGKKNRIISMYEIENKDEVLQPVKVESLGDTLSNLTELMNKFK